MMNGPFFRSYSKQHPSRSVPVQQTQQRSSPKVISVPVHFVSSEQPRTMLKDSAAVKIQKVLRGFVVRKSVKKIASIRNEVSEIERRLDDIEVVNLIGRDAKERLRVNETLMSLLLKLDSVRGVDCGIRDLRKAVTKKAIALQEKVDSIAHQTLDSDSIDPDTACTSVSEQVSNPVDEMVDNNANLEADVVKEAVNPADVIGEEETSDAVDFGQKDDDDVQKHNCANYSKENRAILEDLMGDNEKIMKLLNQISERNEMQTRMINSLSRRVDQLEKAEKLRKKKKTHVPLRRRIDKDSFYI